MKTIGIIGRLGPPSTLKYYEWLNDGVQKALGGFASANIILTSVNGLDVAAFRNAKDDAGEGTFFARHAKLLENAGADFILIASNTSHRNASYVNAAVKIPLLHLADATAQKAVNANVTKVALLGYSIATGSRANPTRVWAIQARRRCRRRESDPESSTRTVSRHGCDGMD